MTATTSMRMTDFAGLLPARGTFPIAADTIIYEGTQVALDSAGRAQEANTIANGAVTAVGKASATYDNRTGSTLGGAAGAVDVEVEYGVFEWFSAGSADTIAADDVGKVCFMVDNQTVALTNGTDTRGIAGLISEVRDDKIFVWQGPHVAALIVVAASEASQLDTAQVDIDALEVDVANLQADALVGFKGFALAEFREIDANADMSNIAANGGILASDTTPVLRGSAAETFEIFWATGNLDAIGVQCVLPPDFNGAANATVDLWVRSGTTNDASFTVETSWDDGTVVVDSVSDVATKSATLHKITATIAAADIQNAARLLTLQLTPSTAHATDTYSLLGVALNYSRIQT